MPQTATQSRRKSRKPDVREGSYSLTNWLGIGAVYLAIAFLVFTPTLRSFFHSDDFVLLDQIQRGGPFALWTHAPSGFLRPVISLTLYADLRLYGLNPFGYHLFNILVHVANCLLVTALGLRLFPPKRANSLSLFAGVLFLLQPFHAESVCWVSGRTDLVATFFFLAALLAYQRYRETRSPAALAVSLLLFVPGLFSKESVAVLPLIVLLWECLLASRDRQPGRRFPLFAVATFFALTVGFVVLRRCLLGALIGGYGTNTYLSFGPRHLMESALWYMANVQLPILGREIWYIVAFIAEAALVFWRWRGFGAAKRQPLPGIALVLLLTCAVSILPTFTLAGGVADGISGRLAYLPSVFGLMTLVLLADYVCDHRPEIVRYPLVLLALIFACQLYVLGKRWLVAGEMAHDVIFAALKEPPAKNRVFLAVPDCLYPAYVLRNGLPEAMHLFGTDRESETVTFASSAFLFSRDDSVAVQQTGPNQFRLTAHYTRPLSPNEAAVSVLFNDSTLTSGHLVQPGVWEVTLHPTAGESVAVESYEGQGSLAPLPPTSGVF